MKFIIAALATVSARHHHHHHTQELTMTTEQYEQMSEDDLLINLQNSLVSAQTSEARGDGDAAVAKTAAIKNI